MGSHHVSSRAALAGALLLSLFAPARDLHSEVLLRRVALSGDQAPGAPAGAVFAQFGTFPGVGDDFPPRIDAAGNVAFHAVLEGTGVTGVGLADGNGLGIWKQVAGVTSMIARQDDPAPGTAGAEFRGFTTGLVPEPPAIAAGRSLFAGALRGPGVDEQFGTNVHGLWRESATGLALAVRATDSAPGLPAGHTLQIIGIPAVNSAGRYMFNGVYATPGQSPGSILGDQEGFWSDRSGVLAAVALGSYPAPGVEAGVVFGKGSPTAIEGAFRSWGTNDAFEFAVNGNLRGPGIGDLNDEGIWIEQSGALTLLVREGDPSPAVGPGVRFGINSGIDTFGDVVPLRMNGRGAILFGARHRGGSVPFTRGVWTTRSGALELVAYGSIPLTGSAPGSPAPGMGPGATFSAIPFAELDDENRIALSGFATIDMDFNNQPQGVWWDQPGTLTLVTREGDPALGLPDLEFAGFNRTLSFAGGTLAFLADLRDRVSQEGRGVALVLADAAGGLHLIARTGVALDVSGNGSDLRIVAAIVPGSVSPAGEIPFELGFADGSTGLFVGSVTSLVDVPAGGGSAPHVSLVMPAPNPRRSAEPLTLRFTMDVPGTVRFSLHDLAGRVVAARPPETFSTGGAHEVRWDPGRLAAGVYFVRLELDSGSSAVARCVMVP